MTNDAADVEEGDGAPSIDAHAHVFARSMPIAADAWTVPQYDFTASDYLAVLDAHGVGFGVLAALSISGTNNDYTLDAIAGQPRLRATVNVPVDIARDTLRAMADRGAIGVRFQLVRRPELPDFTDGAHRRLFALLRDLGWHVHVAVEGPRLPHLLAALGDAGVGTVIDHFGHPDPALGMGCPSLDAMIRAGQGGRTWIKLSGGFRLNGPESWRTRDDAGAEEFGDAIAARLLHEIGPSRLLWGSDCPFVGYENQVTYAGTIERFHTRVPRPADRRAIDAAAHALFFA